MVRSQPKSSASFSLQASNIASVVTVLLLLLLQNLEAIEGAACPPRAVYIPEQTVGVPRPNTQQILQPVKRFLTVGQPGLFQAECCGRGRIVNWTVTTTKDYEDVARVNATCSDGENISTPLYGYNGTWRVVGGPGPQPKFCANDSTNPSQSLFQPDDEGVFPYQSHNWLTNFMGVGSNRGYTKGAVSCPAGTRAIGIGARSGCYALLALQVVCARTNDFQNNLGGALERAANCPAYTTTANNTFLADPGAWSKKEENTRPMYSAASNDTQTECCPIGEGIVGWTIAAAPHIRGNYTGLIQGTCTDGSLLAPVKYGYNGTDSPVCNQQRLISVHHYNTPLTQQFHYSNTSNLLTSFMTPSSLPGVDLAKRKYLSCEPGQGAVGYSAASSCYSLSNVSILCGNLSSSAWEALKKYGSASDNPPVDAEAGVCMGGTSMIPDATYKDTDNNSPIGKIGAWHIPPDNSSRLNPGKTIYSATASALTSICCPSGQAVVGFNVWPSFNINLLVGKVSALCSPYLDGREPTNTSAVAYGFNGHSLNGSASFCPNATHSMATRFLEDGYWTYRSNMAFTRLMEWPERTNEIAYWNGTSKSRRRCPPGQKPLGFAARSSCWGLADFRVICGAVDLKLSVSLESPNAGGLTSGGKAGIAVGVISAFILAVVILGFIFYKGYQKHKRRTCIESRKLFNLNGPAGFHPGVSTTRFNSLEHTEDSRGNTRLMSTQLMTIDNIDRSDDDTPVSFDGIPAEWELKPNQLKLHCVDGKPIELGRGGFGVVLYGTVHKEDAAIKMMKGRSTDSRENELLREIAILELAKTKYVVRFLGYSVCPDGVLLAMEYMPGGTLWNALQESEEFQWHNRGEQAFKDICKGLYMLHINQIAHLDMKTPNILIADDNTCKISDLGLGKLLKSDAQSCTAETTGSFAWMAPEQIHGRCGFFSDIWSLSTIIWEICKRKVPTREASPADIEVPGEAPQAVVDLMIACRQESPNDRPLISTICDLLDSWDASTPKLSGHVSLQL